MIEIEYSGFCRIISFLNLLSDFFWPTSRDEKGQLMIGVRRANRQTTTLPSSVLSADSMHIGVLAAAAHAAANRTPFTVFYNPRYLRCLISSLSNIIFSLMMDTGTKITFSCI